MATEEVQVTRKETHGTWRCEFTGPDGEQRACAKRLQRWPNFVYGVAFFGSFVAGIALSFLRESKGAQAAFSVSVAVVLTLVVLQRVARARYPIEFRTADGFVCSVGADLESTYTAGSRYKVRIPNSAMTVELRFRRKHSIEAQVEGDTMVIAHLRKVGRLEVPTTPMHVDLADRAGRTAILDQSRVNPRAYTLAYDDAFDPQWLLFLVAAVFLYHKPWD
jgi:hypothetical protein